MVKKIIVFVYLILLAGCSKPLHENRFVAAGTYLRVVSSDRRAAGIVYGEFKRLEAIFNAFDPNSEISKLNNSYNEPINVSKDLLVLLSLSAQVTEWTGGAFDVSYGVLYNHWKQFIVHGGVTELPGKDEVASWCGLGGMKNIVIDKERSQVTILLKGLKIDLGGIADGYMVDSAVNKLKEAGIYSALIDVGGDIYCLGTNGKRPWSVGVRDPGAIGSLLQQEFLQDESVTTSGNYEQFFTFQGKRYSHIIDPRNGYPVDNNVVSVTTVAKNCITADSLATAFYVLGEGATGSFLASSPSTMRVFMLLEENGKKRVRIYR